MLATDLVGIMPSRGDVQHQLQCEPRHGADLVPLAVLLDLHVTPCEVAAALRRLGRLDPDSRIVLALALIDGEREEVPQCLQPALLRGRRLVCEHVGDVLAVNGADPVLAVAVTARRPALTEAVEDRTPRRLRRLGKPLGEDLVLQILDHHRVDAAGLDTRRADVRHRVFTLRQQLGVVRHELCAAGKASQRGLPDALAD